jgi:hypothetical protein
MASVPSGAAGAPAGRLVARVNFEEVKPIPHRATLTIVNNFIINTTQFLNRFSYLCEEKLRKASV